MHMGGVVFDALTTIGFRLHAFGKRGPVNLVNRSVNVDSHGTLFGPHSNFVKIHDLGRHRSVVAAYKSSINPIFDIELFWDKI